MVVRQFEAVTPLWKEKKVTSNENVSRLNGFSLIATHSKRIDLYRIHIFIYLDDNWIETIIYSIKPMVLKWNSTLTMTQFNWFWSKIYPIEYYVSGFELFRSMRTTNFNSLYFLLFLFIWYQSYRVTIETHHHRNRTMLQPWLAPWPHYKANYH